MRRFILCDNIRRYKQRLRDLPEGYDPSTLLKLLADAEVELAACEERPERARRS